LSPDGRQVAFCWDGDGEPGLYVKLVGKPDQVRLASGRWGVFSPAWSPDGREIAFLRNTDPEKTNLHEIVALPARGGSERRLTKTTSDGHGLDWSADGGLLAFVDKANSTAPDAISLLSLPSGERRQLTKPPQITTLAGDSEPAFSTDGTALAFVRYHGKSNASDVYVQSLNADVPRPLTSNRRGISDVGWTNDGASVVFAGGTTDERGLWVVSASSGGPARRLLVGEDAMAVSVSRVGDRLALATRFQDINIWREPGPAASGLVRPTLLISSTRSDYMPEFSPDGKRITFASTRTGRHAIFMCDADGRACVEFEAPQRLAYPRWSPDGTRIAADGWDDLTTNIDIYVLDVRGRFVQRFTDDPASDAWPMWSNDGRWLYFASNRTGEFELWRMPAQGGEQRQITRHGASSAVQDHDGRWIYYCKSAVFGPLWRVPSEGGEEQLVLDHRVHFRNWWLWRDRLVYVHEKAVQNRDLQMLDLVTGRSQRLASLGGPAGSGLAISPDGKWALYSQVDRDVGDVMMVDDFR
jgi:Tol biopolymer transport system component